MWQAETKRLIVDKVWLGSGSTNSGTGVTINTSASITLVEGITIKSAVTNTNNDAVIVYSTASQGGGGNYTLYAGEELFLPVSTPNTINIAASANTVNYSFVAW